MQGHAPSRWSRRSMVDATVEELRRRPWRRAGVLGVGDPTIYTEPLERLGIACETVDAGRRASTAPRGSPAPCGLAAVRPLRGLRFRGGASMVPRQVAAPHRQAYRRSHSAVGQDPRSSR